jgi:hypothetical protein
MADTCHEGIQNIDLSRANDRIWRKAVEVGRVFCSRSSVGADLGSRGERNLSAPESADAVSAKHLDERSASPLRASVVVPAARVSGLWQPQAQHTQQ